MHRLARIVCVLLDLPKILSIFSLEVGYLDKTMIKRHPYSVVLWFLGVKLRMPSVSPEKRTKIRGWCNLGKKIGFICCFLKHFSSLECFLLAHDEANELLDSLMLYFLLVFFLIDQYCSSPRSQLALIRPQSELFLFHYFLFKTNLFGEPNILLKRNSLFCTTVRFKFCLFISFY